MSHTNMWTTEKVTCQHGRQRTRQTDRYFIDRKEVIADLFVIEMREIYVHVYNIVYLLKNYVTIYMV